MKLWQQRSRWLKDIPLGSRAVTILCDTSTGQARPIVPVTIGGDRIIDVIHSLAHLSVRTTRKHVAAKYIWSGLQNQVGTWVGKAVHRVPLFQGTDTRQSPTPEVWHPPPPVRPHSCPRPGRAAASFQWFHPPPHCGQPFFSMARGDPSQ